MSEESNRLTANMSGLIPLRGLPALTAGTSFGMGWERSADWGMSVPSLAMSDIALPLPLSEPFAQLTRLADFDGPLFIPPAAELPALAAAGAPGWMGIAAHFTRVVAQAAERLSYLLRHPLDTKPWQVSLHITQPVIGMGNAVAKPRSLPYSVETSLSVERAIVEVTTPHPQTRPPMSAPAPGISLARATTGAIARHLHTLSQVVNRETNISISRTVAKATDRHLHTHSQIVNPVAATAMLARSTPSAGMLSAISTPKATSPVRLANSRSIGGRSLPFSTDLSRHLNRAIADRPFPSRQHSPKVAFPLGRASTPADRSVATFQLLSRFLPSSVPNIETAQFASPGRSLAQTPPRVPANPLPLRSAAPPPLPAAAPPVPSVTVSGGIHVAISAQKIDPDRAEETARAIADRVMRELNRISDRDRFRRGLPPTSL